MGQAHPHSGGHTPGGGGPDSLHDMALGKIVVVGIVSLALFAAGIFWAYRLMVGREGEVHAQGAASAPTKIGQLEIGIVDQPLFDIDQRLDLWRAEKKKKLSTFGWIDRAKGIAHMPIEQAMQEVVAHPPEIPGEGVPASARAPVGQPSPAAPGVKAPPGKPEAQP